MIKGIGTDLVDIRRIERCITKYGDRFLRKVFTEAEIRLCAGKANPSVHFAGRWAAKEAFYKALPVSCQPVSFWKSVQFLAFDESGRPVVEILSNELKERMARENISSFHASISHEQAYCLAFVIAE